MIRCESQIRHEKPDLVVMNRKEMAVISIVIGAVGSINIQLPAWLKKMIGTKVKIEHIRKSP